MDIIPQKKFAPVNIVDFRPIVSLIIILMFGGAFLSNPRDETLRGALVTAFATAVGYYLGSSKGAAENRETLNKLHEKNNGQP